MFNKPTSGFESKKVTVSGVGRDESAWITFGKLTLGKHWFMVETDMFCNMKEENLHNNMKVMNVLAKKKIAFAFIVFKKLNKIAQVIKKFTNSCFQNYQLIIGVDNLCRLAGGQAPRQADQ